MMAFAIACGGDVDTIAAMAGAMWGAANGASKLPVFLLEQRAYIQQTAQLLFEAGHAACTPHKQGHSQPR